LFFYLNFSVANIEILRLSNKQVLINKIYNHFSLNTNKKALNSGLFVIYGEF